MVTADSTVSAAAAPPGGCKGQWQGNLGVRASAAHRLAACSRRIGLHSGPRTLLLVDDGGGLTPVTRQRPRVWFSLASDPHDSHQNQPPLETLSSSSFFSLLQVLDSRSCCCWQFDLPNQLFWKLLHSFLGECQLLRLLGLVFSSHLPKCQGFRMASVGSFGS